VVPENGLISLNVPIDPLRLGSLSTRTTHPFYMARWDELLAALGIPARAGNPYQFHTKGEMLSRCADQRLLHATMTTSMSCASPTKGRWIGHPIEHCGYCVPCLIRRAAIVSAFSSDPTQYTLSDLTGRKLNTEGSEGKQVRSFQLAAERLRKRPDIAHALIHKTGPLTDWSDQLPDLAGVYQRGMAELDNLLSSVTAEPP
jgi:hypothetical protein